jgi:hypothetical protein
VSLISCQTEPDWLEEKIFLGTFPHHEHYEHFYWLVRVPGPDGKLSSDPSPPHSLPCNSSIDEAAAHAIVLDISSLEAEAKDALLTSKVSQAHYANLHRSPKDIFSAGNKVFLKTLHRMHEYKDDDKKHILKFILCFDRPYEITDVHAETFIYIVSMPSAHNTFPIFHSSVLH